jgi:hypothetical protein
VNEGKAEESSYGSEHKEISVMLMSLNCKISIRVMTPADVQ